MKVDTHGHFIPTDYAERIAVVRPELARILKYPMARAAGASGPLLESMDRAGVDHTVLGIGFHQPWVSSRYDALALAQLCNNRYAELVNEAPARLSALGCLPLPHIDDALHEADRCLSELEFKGFSFGTKVEQAPLDAPQFEPVWQELNRRNAIVQIHPSEVVPMDSLGLGLSLLGPGMVCMACARLAMSGVTTRYPRIRFIATCLGGLLPLFHERMQLFYQRMAPEAEGSSRIDALSAVRSFYYDTEYLSADALRCTCEVVGVDKVVFGSNFPFDDLARSIAKVEDSGLPQQSVRAILSDNPIRLFGLE